VPSTRISTGSWIKGREIDLINVVQDCLLEGLGIPDWDRDILLHTFDEQHRILPGHCTDRSTRIEIILYVGRNIEIKRKFYKITVDKLEAFGIPRLDTKIILLEMPRDNWGIRGGFAGSDIDPGPLRSEPKEKRPAKRIVKRAG